MVVKFDDIWIDPTQIEWFNINEFRMPKMSSKDTSVKIRRVLKIRTRSGEVLHVYRDTHEELKVAENELVELINNADPI